MTKSNFKLNIQQDHLIWFLALLLNEREIFQLLMNSGLDSNSEKLHPFSKQELLNRLATSFFEQPNIDEIVVKHMEDKAETAISRVGYMAVEEIQTYFKSPNPLLESGEFGDVVWALLVDSREEVHSHGIQLLNTAYEDHKASFDQNQPGVFPHIITSPQIPSSEIREIQTGYTSKSHDASNISDSQQNEIHRLQMALDNLRAQYSAIGKKNKRLEQHCQYLLEENKTLKTKVDSFLDKEKQLVFLQQENKILQENAIEYAETNDSLIKLDAEHKLLTTKYDDISKQLNELAQIKASKDTFMVELKLVEEAVYKENQALEQLKSDLQNHFDMLEKSHEVSQNALNQIRQTVNFIDVPHLDVLPESDEIPHQPRVGVFVDVQNMFYAAKDRFERRVDYIKLLDLIVGPRELISAYAYIVQIPEINQSNFLSLLEHNGYTIRSKDLRLRGDGSAKGDWDVGIAVDVVSMLGKLDVVILASGDGDFCPLAELIKQQNKRIEVVAFEHNTSMDLQAMADQFFAIGEELLM